MQGLCDGLKLKSAYITMCADFEREHLRNVNYLPVNIFLLVKLAEYDETRKNMT